MKKSVNFSSFVMKWFLPLFFVFFISMKMTARQYDGYEKIYLRPSAVSWWLDASAKVGLKFSNETTSSLVEVVWLVDNDGGNIYSVSVPEGDWTNVAVTRHSGLPISDGNQWNSTSNLSIPSEVNYIQYFENASSTVTWQSLKAHYRSKASGDWSSLSTWRASFDTNWTNTWNSFDAHYVPNNNDWSVTIMDAHNVTLNQNSTISSLTINVGGTFTSSDASPRTLTISKSSSGSSETLANSGTWANGAGGSTVVFTGAPSAGDAVHTVSGTNAFQKVIVNKTSGSSNVGCGFGANSSVSQSLEIGNGGYISSAPPASFYGSEAILKFNQGTGANYDVNASDYTWSTSVVPNSITINSGTVTINENREATGTVVVDLNSALVLSAGKQLTVGTLTNNGTFTVKNGATVLSTTVSGTGTNNVEQALAAGRQWWYLSSPLSAATSNVFSPAESTNKIGYYTESTTSYSAPYAANAGTALTAGKGYVVKLSNTDGGTYTFTGGNLNNGDLTINPTRTGTTAPLRGFNLIGNPYPSYLNWDNLHDNSSTNMRDAIWYRTFSDGAMTFHTYGDGDASPETTSPLIAPMQAFWVKVNADGLTGSLTFKNIQRSHFTSGANALKVKSAEMRPRLRLQITNGLTSDETLLVGKSYASNLIDAYDIEKMPNSNPAIPEIYSFIQNQELVINSMNQMANNETVILGFRPGQAGDFTLKVSQLEYVDNQVILKDQLLNKETELTPGKAYTFTSDATTTNNRFSIEFRTPGVVTETIAANASNTFVFVNNDNQITIQSSALNRDDIVRVYSATGQLVDSQNAEGTVTTINKHFNAGIYIVKINQINQKVVVK